MKDEITLWIFQTGEPLHIDKEGQRPMRAVNLANTAIKHGFKVVLWSSAFNHQNKIHRSKKYKVILQNKQLEIRLIPSRGYSKHIGLGRLIDHMQMAWNLIKILRTEKTVPNVAFIGYPPIETAFVMSRWLKNKQVPMLLDVKDLWPSIFIEAFPNVIRPIAKIVFFPYFYLARYTMRNVSGISSMSRSYIEWCLFFSGKQPSSNDIVARLTTANSNIDRQGLALERKRWKNIGVYDKKDIKRVFFVGTFSAVFEFDDIIDAAKQMPKCQFVLCGHGPCLTEIKSKAGDLSNVVFPGWIDRFQMESLAEMSLATLAPYKNVENFTLNIPNKIVDSLLLGLPILSPLKGEVESLIKNNKVGFTYGNNSMLVDCIQSLIDDDKLRKEMSINAKKLYKDEFEFNKVYDGLVAHLKNMVEK